MDTAVKPQYDDCTQLFNTIKAMTKPIIILAGPTASGKTALAIEVAKEIGAIIVNCDSKQLYKEIPIITAQPTIEERQNIPHELFGVLSASRHCSVGKWLDMATKIIDQIHQQGKIPLLVGGTGMYIKSLIEGIQQIPDIDLSLREKIRLEEKESGSPALHKKLQQIDPESAAKLEENDGIRIMRAYEVMKQTGKSLSKWQQEPGKIFYPGESFSLFFLNKDRQEVYDNCNKRFLNMIDEGVIEEIKALDAMKLDPKLPAMKAHGVPELIAYLHDEMSIEDAINRSQQNTRNYIKRQFTWFRGQMPGAVEVSGNFSEMLSLIKGDGI